MPRRTWVTRIDGIEHRIELEHQVWSGRRRVVVDGWEVHKGKKLLDLGEDIPFIISGHHALLRIAPYSLGYAYALALDERWIGSGSVVARMPWFARISGYALIAHGLFLLAIAALIPAPADTATDLTLLATRALVAPFIALQLFGGLRKGWFAALGYGWFTLALVAATGGVAMALGVRTDGPASSLPSDLRSPVGLAGDILFALVVLIPLLLPAVRAFFDASSRSPDARPKSRDESPRTSPQRS